MGRVLWLACVVLVLGLTGAQAQTCGGSYRVQSGDSLSLIAEQHYKNAFRWTRIYSANRRAIGDDPDAILVGTVLQLACIDGLPQTVAATSATPPAETVQDPPEEVLAVPAMAAPEPGRLRVVTGDGMPPFSDSATAGGGMIAEIMTAALSVGQGAEGFETFRINDWAAHLDPLLAEGLMDVAFPQIGADCADPAVAALCERVLFSAPMFEMLMLLFVPVDQPIPLLSGADLRGRVLCRQAGWPVYMLNTQGRNWLADGHVSVQRASTATACFEMLLAGEADAVLLNEFTGRSVIAAQGLQGQVMGMKATPVSIVSLHAAVPRAAPQAAQTVARLNEGLREMRASGSFQSILDRHLADIWAGL